MDNIYIRGLDMPARVRGVTVKDNNGDFNVYINTLLCPETQTKAALHEVKHIKLNHFYDCQPVIVNELQAQI